MYVKFQLYQQGAGTRNAKLRSHFEFLTPRKGQFSGNDAIYTLGLLTCKMYILGLTVVNLVENEQPALTLSTCELISLITLI